MVCARVGGYIFYRLSVRAIRYAAVRFAVVRIVARPRRDRCAADGNARHAARRICRAAIRPAVNGRRAVDDRLPLCDRKGARFRRSVDIVVARIGDGIAVSAGVPGKGIVRLRKAAAVVCICHGSGTIIAEAVALVKITCRDGRQLDRLAVHPAGGAHDRDLVIRLIDIPRQRFIGKVVRPVRTPAIIIAVFKGKDDRISALLYVDGRRRAARRYHGTFVWRRILCPDSFTRIGVMFLRQFGQLHPLAGDGEVSLFSCECIIIRQPIHFNAERIRTRTTRHCVCAHFGL